MAKPSNIKNPTTIEQHKSYGDGASTINRRRMLTMGSALAIASVSAVSVATNGAVAGPRLDDKFNAKCRKYDEAKGELDRLYAANSSEIKKLIRPKFPKELLKPLNLPVRGKTSPDKDGWSATELARIGNEGRWEVFVKSENAAGMTLKSKFYPVSPGTKSRAAELLKLRVSYDGAQKSWWSKVKKIEDSTLGPLDAMLEAVRLVTEHPVTSFADIQRKIQVTDDAGLFDCYGEPEDNARECIFRDIRALGADETTTSLAGKGGYFNDTGFPVGNGWDEIDVPGVTDNTAYALEITGDSMLPVYREGDTIIVSPGATVRKGDRVVVKTTDGQVMATIMQRQTAKNVELASFNAAHDTKTLDMKDVDWMARIIWASQ